jgi:hypothetical protein
LLAEGVDAFAQLMDLGKSILVLSGNRLHLRNLLLDFFEFLLCLDCRVHRLPVTVPGMLPLSFYHAEQKIRSGDMIGNINGYLHGRGRT